MVKIVCDVQTSQPKAVPTLFEIPSSEKIKAIENGNAPKPPFENPIAKLPKTKPIMMMSKLMS